MSLKVKIVTLLIFITVISCQNKKAVNEKATILFKQASEVFRKNYSNNDSLMYSISLLDSSIRLGAQPKFYFTKYQVSMLLKRYDLAINSTNGVLAIDRNNFMALFGKGIALECSKEIDSAMSNYKLALKSLESTRFETSIFKEHQRIILYCLLKDTANFNLKLIEFKEKYSGNKEFSSYYKSLIQFDRSAYLNSY